MKVFTGWLGICFMDRQKIPDLLPRMKSIIDSRKLLAFVTLARCGSFTQTARELYLTQSAVSHAIRALEDELETRLFDRLGRHVRLTATGEQLLEHATKILAEMQSARVQLAQIAELKK
jgi:DNA-binding transcriptional LysR family regulator